MERAELLYRGRVLEEKDDPVEANKRLVIYLEQRTLDGHLPWGMRVSRLSLSTALKDYPTTAVGGIRITAAAG